MLSTELADSTGDKHHLFTINSSLLVKNYSVRNGTITIKLTTTIFKTTNFQIPNDISNQAMAMIHPSSPQMKISAVLTSPLKLMRTVEGTIVKVRILLQ